MSEIVKCSCCRKILTRKQFQSHECKIPWRKTKEFPILYYIELDTIEEPKVLGVGLDGVHYFFVVKKPVALPFIRRHLSDESLHVDESDEDYTEPYFRINELF